MLDYHKKYSQNLNTANVPNLRMRSSFAPLVRCLLGFRLPVPTCLFIFRDCLTRFSMHSINLDTHDAYIGRTKKQLHSTATRSKSGKSGNASHTKRPHTINFIMNVSGDNCNFCYRPTTLATQKQCSQAAVYLAMTCLSLGFGWSCMLHNHTC